MADYVLVGGGALAREIHDWFTPSLSVAGDRFIGYLDDGDQPMLGTGIDLPQLGTIVGFRADPSHLLVMAIATPKGKEVVARKLTEAGGVFATMLHPTAWISASARIGQGVVVNLFASVSANATLGAFTMLLGCTGVAHDAVLGDYSTLCGNAELAGFAKVGAGSFIGSSARVLPNVRIGAGCTVGAGSIVVRAVPDGATVYAAPARRL